MLINDNNDRGNWTFPLLSIYLTVLIAFLNLIPVLPIWFFVLLMLPADTSQGSRPTTVPRPPTVLREYLESRTNLTTQAGRKAELQSQPNLLTQTVPEEL